MKLRHVYLLLAILGTILPYSQFIPFLLAHGLNLSLFFQQLFANYISGFFGVDVVVSAIVLFVFVFAEGRRTPRDAPIVVNRTNNTIERNF